MKRALLLLLLLCPGCSGSPTSSSTRPKVTVVFGPNCGGSTGYVRRMFQNGSSGGDYKVPCETFISVGDDGSYRGIFVARDRPQDTILDVRGVATGDVRLTPDCH